MIFKRLISLGWPTATVGFEELIDFDLKFRYWQVFAVHLFLSLPTLSLSLLSIGSELGSRIAIENVIGLSAALLFVITSIYLVVHLRQFILQLTHSV